MLIAQADKAKIEGIKIVSLICIKISIEKTTKIALGGLGVYNRSKNGAMLLSLRPEHDIATQTIGRVTTHFRQCHCRLDEVVKPQTALQRAIQLY